MKGADDLPLGVSVARSRRGTPDGRQLLRLLATVLGQHVVRYVLRRHRGPRTRHHVRGLGSREVPEGNCADEPHVRAGKLLRWPDRR